MKIKVAIEFEIELGNDVDMGEMYYQRRVKDLAKRMADNAIGGNYNTKYTGEWAYMVEGEHGYEDGILNWD